MPKFHYAKGRISESIQFISQEMKEYEQEYAHKVLKDYQNDRKIQKLMDRTLENNLNALIEICGTILIEEGIAVESYSDALKKCGKLFNFTDDEQNILAKLALQRNRLAHRYLNLRWQAITMYTEQRKLVKKLIMLILAREEKKKTDLPFTPF